MTIDREQMRARANALIFTVNTARAAAKDLGALGADAAVAPPRAAAKDPDELSPLAEALLSGATVVCQLPPPGARPGAQYWRAA